MWQDKLLNNLIVFGILFGIGVIVWCKIKNQTLTELFRDIRGAMGYEEP